MLRRIVTGGRCRRRPALAVAVAGILMMGGLVPALAADSDADRPGSRRPAKARSLRKTAAERRDQLVVRMTRPGGRNEEDALAASVGGRHRGRLRPGVFRVDVPEGRGASAAHSLRQDPAVAGVEDDVRFRSAETGTTPPLTPSGAPTGSAAGAAPPPVNERCFSGCALTFDGGNTSRIYSQSAFMHIGAAEAWAVTKGDPDMLVAVLDTDVDASHPDLAGKVIVGPNFSCASDPPDADPKNVCVRDETPDPEGHGTAVAGLIAAIPNNGMGIAGLGWNTRVLSVRVLNGQGVGHASEIAQGIEYAASYPGVKVINLSLQQDSDSAAKVNTQLRDAIRHAQSQGILVVSAVGNQPLDMNDTEWAEKRSTPAYPANFDGVLSVAAVDGSSHLAGFSRRGTWVDIAAPGVGVLTLATPCADGNCWVTPDGTSFAAPIVSAAAALVWATKPELTAEEVAARLMSTANSVEGTGRDFASGEVNVARAVGNPAAGPLQMSPPGAPAPAPTQISATSTPLPGPTGKGYWLVASDGGIFSYGNATFLGSTGGIRLNKPIVGMAATPDGNGYWLVASDGGIFAFGDAEFFGSTGSIDLKAPIVGMTPTPSGKGYWLVASDGGIFAFGDAPFFGSTGAMHLNQPIVGLAPTTDGDGYWLVASDGGIFAFGGAWFYGSTGNLRLRKPVVGLAPSPDGDGYWMVAADGGVFAFAGSAFYGSPAGTVSGTVIGLAPTPSGNGYWIVADDGSIYNFGAAQYFGGLGGTPLNRPIVGLAIR